MPKFNDGENRVQRVQNPVDPQVNLRSKPLERRKAYTKEGRP